MKTLHLSIIIFTLVLVSVSSQTAFAQKAAYEILQERDVLGQSSDPVHVKDHKQYVNFTEMSTKLEHNGAILVVRQTVNKLEYKVDEKITVHCALVNIGNNAVSVNALVRLLQSTVTYPNGSSYFEIQYPVLLIGGDATIEPGMEISDPDCIPSGKYPPDPSSLKISTPGIYNITSFAHFTINDKSRSDSQLTGIVWSNPFQITILPEKYLQNETSPVSQDCIDGMTQNMKTKYASFDEERAKTEAVNYDAFKSEVKDDKYTFRAVSQEWINDQVKCDATFKTALVLFIVTDTLGKQRDVTVLVNPESYQPRGIDVQYDVPTHPGVITTNLNSYVMTGNSTYNNSVYTHPRQMVPMDDRLCCDYTIPIIVVTLGGVALLVILVYRGKIKT